MWIKTEDGWRRLGRLDPPKAPPYPGVLVNSREAVEWQAEQLAVLMNMRERNEALDELVAQAQELDMGY